jgi:ribose transport system substrate-binding protein
MQTGGKAMEKVLTKPSIPGMVATGAGCPPAKSALRSLSKRALGVSVLALGLAALPTIAGAEDFHGFDPLNYSGVALSADQLKAMVADAVANHKPRDGKTLTIGFANLERDITFCQIVEDGVMSNAKAAGINVIVTDNHLDGATALANAQSMVSRKIDYALEFQTDANFAPTIVKTFKDDGVDVTAIDIPMPGATFFAVNNPRGGFMAASYLAEAAVQARGADQVAKGYVVLGALPQSGAIVGMRTKGQIAGLKAVLPTFPDDHIIQIDTKNTLQEAFAQMSNVLSRIPEGVPILVTAINDQATSGMIRAVKQAGREADLFAVGMGGDELPTMLAEKTWVASVDHFPERYGNYLVPIALMSLAGKPVPSAIVLHHEMITKANVCKYNPKYPCDPKAKDIDYKFPQSEYTKFLASLESDPDLANYRSLIPAN